MSRKLPQIVALAGVIAVGGLLEGCGKQGNLERPGPLFGKPSASVAARRQQQDPNRPIDTRDPRDDFATPAPPRTLPIPGEGSNPTAPASPQGALTDPYANPPR
jgi:hypothetical protein